MSGQVAKLYYTPTSCGAASFIAAHIADLKIDFEQVNIRTKKTASGADFLAVNPKGNVPTLVLPGGVVLFENSATLQWIADQAPDAKLAPPYGTTERYELINMLSFLGTELHTSSGPLFNPQLSGDARDAAVKKLLTKYEYMDKHLLNKNKKFLLGDQPTIADYYAYIVLSWAPFFKVSYDEYPNVKKYFETVAALPQVQAAHKRMSELPQAGH